MKEPRLKAWIPPVEVSALKTVTAIWAQEGRKMDRKAHMGLLTGRVQTMVEAEADPEEAADRLLGALDDRGLAPDWMATRGPETAAIDLLMENPRFQEFLNLAIPTFPDQPAADNLEARKILADDKALGLNHWIENLILP